MRTMRHLLEVACFKRRKAYCLVRDASRMPLAEDRARLTQYAKFFEEEAVKLEECVRDLQVSARRSEANSRGMAKLMEKLDDYRPDVAAGQP
jgi:hypothetical protein